MPTNVGLYSYLTAFTAYAVLTLFLVTSTRGRSFATVLIVSSALTTLWAGVIAAGTLMEYPPVVQIQLAELLRNAGWIFFLLQLTSLRFDGDTHSLAGRPWLTTFMLVLGATFVLFLVLPHLPDNSLASNALFWDATYIAWLGMAILVFALLEQIFRNASGGERWSIKYLCFGLGGLFAFDFFMYAEALMLRQLDQQLWQARGLVGALAAPLIAIGISRTADWKQQLQVSRQVVFHTVSLLGAGLYLLMMAVAGYYIKFIGSTWGGVLQISFLIAAGGLLLALFFSGKIRANARVFLSKHFFTYKYDYREEWLKFTENLAEKGDATPDRITGTIAKLVDSPAGLLWASTDTITNYRLLSHWQMTEPAFNIDMRELASWMRQSQWVIDIDELYREPDLYNGLTPPAWLSQIDDAWLLIPLMFNDELLGILLLKHSPLQQAINWEDRDLLKTAGRQAASHLAQFLSNQALVEARQFDAFNRLSAYVIHDLKNILAQQSLIVSNAEKHKQNPAFVEDMIHTVDNSVNRMTKLMEQMRSGVRGADPRAINLAELLQEVVQSRVSQQPEPQVSAESPNIVVRSDGDRLKTVFSHLIQNAQEASENDGRIEVRIKEIHGTAVVEIEDNGKGMDEEFLKKRLFKPFESTKGLTGMGIGAFESREFIRSLGGDIKVESAPGRGSVFKVFLPVELYGERIHSAI